MKVIAADPVMRADFGAAEPREALEHRDDRGVHGRLWRKALATEGGAAARNARASVGTPALKAGAQTH
jgi:hypothetical protein